MPIDPQSDQNEMDAVNAPPVIPDQVPEAPKSALDLFKSATQLNSVTSEFIHSQAYPQPTFAPVKGFDPEVSVPKGYEPWAPAFIGASSPGEIEQRRQKLDQDHTAERNVARYGWWGTAASMAADISDPFTIASFAVAPELGPARLGNMLAHGGAFGLQVAAKELALQQYQPGRTGEQSAINIASASVLGGLIGAVLRPKIPAPTMTELALKFHDELHGAEMADPTVGPDAARSTIVPQGAAEMRHLEGEVSAHLTAREAALHEQAHGQEAFAVDLRGDQGASEARLTRAQAELDRLSKPLMEDRNTQIEEEIDRLKNLTPEGREAERAAKGETQATVQSLDEIKASNASEAERLTVAKIEEETAAHRAAATADREAYKRQLHAQQREGAAPWEPSGDYPAREQVEPEAAPAEGAAPVEETPEQKALRAQATQNVQRMRDGLTARQSHARHLIESLSTDTARARRVMSARSSLSVLRQGLSDAKNLSDKASLLPEGLRQAYERRIAKVAEDNKITPAAVTQGLPDVPANISNPEHPINPNAESTSGAAQVAGPDLRGEGIAKGAGAYLKATGWVSPGIRLLRSPNIVSRQILQKLAHLTILTEKNMKGFAGGFKSEVSVEKKLWGYDGIHVQAQAARAESFKAYRERLAESQTPAMNRRDFNEQIAKSMRRNDAHDIPEVAQAAKDTRRIAWEPLKQKAIKVGALPADVDVKFADSYLMRQYDIKKIDANHSGWIDTLTDGFMKQGADHGEALDIAHRVTRNIRGAEGGTLNLRLMDGIVPKSGRLKERTLSLPDTMLEDYLVNDIESLEHSYHRSLAPEVELLDKFQGDDRNLSGAIADMHDEYSRLMERAPDDKARAALLSSADSDLRDITAIRDRLYGIYGAVADPSSFFVRAGRLLRSANASRLLGVAALSHLPDLANVMMRYGMPQTIKGMAKLISSGPAMKMALSTTKRFSAALDMSMSTSAALLGDYANHSQWAPQQLANRATRMFTVATGETPIITMTQAMASTLAQDELVRFAQKAVAGQSIGTFREARLLSMGIDKDMLLKFAAEHETSGVHINGLNFAMTDKWADQEAAQVFESAVRGEAHTVTLRPGVADTSLWLSQELGKSIGQFKSFGFAANNSVVAPMLQGIAHGDIRTAQGIAMLGLMGTASYYLKQKIAGRPAEHWNSPMLAAEILDKSNLLGWTGEWIFPLANQLGMPSMSRFSDRDPAETLGGPTVGAAFDAFNRALPGRALSPIRRALSGETEEEAPGFRRSDVHFLRKLAPGQNYLLTRKAINNVEDWIGNKFDLPGKSNAEKLEEAHMEEANK